MGKYLDLLKNGTNVYRTKHFVVIQNISFGLYKDRNNAILSEDIFYKRTYVRDKQYEHIFKERNNINGKRLHSTMYSRIYID
ncbi:MAG: hypothetical protein E7359_00045 [Clostridiales bacterium]|nr:hypothetical protein [Clostridiales bacterium]